MKFDNKNEFCILYPKAEKQLVTIGSLMLPKSVMNQPAIGVEQYVIENQRCVYPISGKPNFTINKFFVLQMN